jgi:hypothetical protein
VDGAWRRVGDWLPSAGEPIRATLRPRADDLPKPAAFVEPPADLPPVEAPQEAPAPASATPPETSPAQPSDVRPATREPERLVTIPGAYVDAKQLTELPRPLGEPPMHLLASILARAGKARLLLYIDQSGRVTQIEVETSTLPPEATERAVIVFSGMRFTPGRIAGLAVRSRVPITVGAEERKPGD